MKIAAADGVQLDALIFEPETAPKGVVQINAATAARRSYYVPFARFLAENGFVSCVWDYRGSGHSAPADIRACGYRMSDYGRKDMPAVLDHLDDLFPSLPKLLVGHSVGAQQVGFMPNNHKLRGLVAFATSVGYPYFMPLGYRMQALFFLHVFCPLSHALFGYNAGRRFKIMEDMPRGVADEWKRWCLRPDYFFDPTFAELQGNFQSLPFPVRVHWASDDPISNATSVPRFWSHVHSDAGIAFRRWEPRAVGVKTIGHFGFFRKQFRETIWEAALAELVELVQKV